MESCIVTVISHVEVKHGKQTLKGEIKINKTDTRHILKRILMVLLSTPREVLYIEARLLDIEATVNKNRINMEKKIKVRKEPDMINNTQRKGWREKTDNLKEAILFSESNMSETRNKTKIV